jgi:ADP-ribosyl-[dinitrogen reductase] hydrolase
VTGSERSRGCLIGLAVGDALGTTVEFSARGSFAPVADMIGGGPFELSPGQWTDDTSMALCLGHSLVERRGFDALDQMRRYCRWQETGYLSSTGKCFDIGRTVSAALDRFRATGDPIAGSTDPQTAGNGCLMRLAPVPMFYAPDLDAASRLAGDSARSTHGAAECVDACRLFARMLVRALQGADKLQVLSADADSFVGAGSVTAIARGQYRAKPQAEISGSGYVIDSLEAALWSFATTVSFRDAVLTAVNLGDDADTTAAICGQLAGAFYGMAGVPSAWVSRLTQAKEIMTLADALTAGGQ